MNKLACMTWPYSGYPLERALAGIAAAGFRYVTLGLPHEGKSVINADAPGEAARLLKLLDQHGLEPVTLISTGPLGPNQPLEAAQQWMDFALALGVSELLSLGTNSYRKFPDGPYSEDEMAAFNHAFAEKFKLVGQEAEKRGLTVTLKPHTGNTAAAKELLETLQSIQSPAVKVSYDPGNIHFYEGIDTTSDLPKVAEHVASFVAKDHQGERAEIHFPVPGEGDVDFPALLTILKEVQFSGPILVERLDGKGESFSAEQIDERLKVTYSHLMEIANKVGLAFQ